MIKIKFNDSQDFLEVSFAKNGNIITLTGDVPANTSGFTTYRMNEVQLGDFSEYTTVYRELAGGVQFSNDGSVWTEPEVVEVEEPEMIEMEPVPYVPSLEERIADLEAAMCELISAMEE